MKYMLFGSLVVVAMITLIFAGCSSNSTESPPSNAPAADSDHEHGNHEHGDHAQSGQADMEKMKEGLAQLSAEDAASAEKQHLCPVSGEMLGTMGAPEKVDVNGQQVWICCAGCKDKLLESPEKYLAKLQQE